MDGVLTEISLVLAGAFYAWIGMLVVLFIDAAMDGAVSRMVGESTALAWGGLVFWPVLAAVALWRHLAARRRRLAGKGHGMGR